MGAHVTRDFVGEWVDLFQRPAGEQAQGQGGGEGIAGADSVDHLDGKPWVAGDFVRAREHGPMGAQGESDEVELKTLQELAKLGRGVSGQTELAGESREFRLVQLEDRRQLEGTLDDLGRVVVLAKVEVKDPYGIGWRGPDERLHRGAGVRSPLGECSKADSVNPGERLDGFRRGFQAVPGDMLVDGEVRLAVDEVDGRGPRGGVGIALDLLDLDPGGGEAAEGFVAEFIRADAGDGERFGSEGAGVVGKVGWGATELAALGEQVPEDLSDAGDSERHDGVSEGLRGCAAWAVLRSKSRLKRV